MPQRTASEEEVRSAQAMTNWAYWFAPEAATAVFLATAWNLRNEDMTLQVILAVFLGLPALLFWFFRIRQFLALRQDLDGGTVTVVDGAPERTWMSRTGLCFVQLQGIRIRIPNNQYPEVRDATTVSVAFLPKSHIAVRVEATHGIGIGRVGS